MPAETLLDWPADWSQTLPVDQVAYRVSDDIIAVLLLFEHGANGLVLGYPGGGRFARVDPATDWALEERFVGDAPDFLHERDVTKTWRWLLNTVIEAGKKAEAELGGRP
jgi:hypothetical protein